MNKISLKEAGRYSNYFTSLLEEINFTAIMGGSSNKIVQFEKTTEIHKKNSALGDPSLSSEEIILNEEVNYLLTLDELQKLVELIIKEKIKLSKAITKAKVSGLLDVEVEKEVYSIDSAIEYTKLLQSTSNDFYGALLDKRDSFDSTKEGKAYTFNEEGNQTPYFYPIEVKVKSFIDKETIVSRNKKVKNLSNTLSMEIDNVSALKVIDFESKFDYLDSFKEMIYAIKGQL